MKSTKEIRKELAILVKKKQAACTTEKERNKALEEARQEINKKYGKGWREGDVSRAAPSIYDGHENGEYWME